MAPVAWKSRVRAAAAAAVMVLLTSCSSLPTGPNDDAWRLLPGHIEKLTVPAFRNGRTCWVYLPPGYSTSTRRYPVLYMNDGETVFDGNSGMHAHRICEDLIRSGEVEPLIIVGVTIPTQDQRFIDYTPWSDWYWRPNGGGDFYLRALRDTLKPEVDRRYRTLPDARNTGIGGASIAGLISAYAAFVYDSTFGKAAAFSPSYWWGDTINIFHVLPAHRRSSLLYRFYQDTGYADDNDIEAMMHDLTDRGFREGVDFLSNTVVGGEHSRDAWEHRFPDMLRFLFPAHPAPPSGIWPPPGGIPLPRRHWPRGGGIPLPPLSR